MRNMRKFLALSFIAAISLSGLSFVMRVDPCNIVELRKASKSSLDPYNYDSQLLKKITITKKPITLETEIPLSLFGKYRMVFNSTGMPVKIPIVVYNKEQSAKKRELIWSNESNAESEKMIVYDPAPHTRRIFVDIEVPSDSLNQKIKGCIYMVLGYK